MVEVQLHSFILGVYATNFVYSIFLIIQIIKSNIETNKIMKEIQERMDKENKLD